MAFSLSAATVHPTQLSPQAEGRRGGSDRVRWEPWEVVLCFCIFFHLPVLYNIYQIQGNVRSLVQSSWHTLQNKTKRKKTNNTVSSVPIYPLISTWHLLASNSQATYSGIGSWRGLYSDLQLASALG